MKEFFSKLFVNKLVEKETSPLIGARFSHESFASNPFDSSGFWNVQVIACKDEWVKFIRQMEALILCHYKPLHTHIKELNGRTDTL